MLIFAALLLCLASFSTAASPSGRRIFNGRPGDRNMFPYQVALTRFGQVFCGGTIIDATHVLSAAHCFQTRARASEYEVLIADNVQTGSNQVYKGRFSAYVNHPEYRNTAAHDLTVITLERPIPLNGRTMKALPLATSRSHEPQTGDEVVVSGFGRTSMNGPMSPTLQYAGQIVTQNRCQPEAICTEARDRQGTHRSACRGDSGGPLEFRGRLVGAVSRGDNCVGHTSFARVSTDASWIQGFLSGSPAQPVVRPQPIIRPQPVTPDTQVTGGRTPRFGGGLDAAGIEAALKGHNDARAAVGMPPLRWSAKLAADAQAYADRCPQGHDSGLLRSLGQGENLYWESPRGDSGSDAAVARRALDPNARFQGRPGSWVAEKDDYDMRSHRCSGVCGHWTQIVWGTTTEVGCAIACRPRSVPMSANIAPSFHLGRPYSPNEPEQRRIIPLNSMAGMLVLVCRYTPAGNMMGERFNTNVARGGGASQPQTPVVRPRPVEQPPRFPVEPRVPVEPRPSTGGSSNPNFLRRGSCPNGVAPRAFYDSGCTAASQGMSTRVTCRLPPPMPLGAIPREQQRQMQSFPSQALQTGDISTCCLASTNVFYCRGPRSGFPPGTPGL
jgi:hypothetical protein